MDAASELFPRGWPLQIRTITSIINIPLIIIIIIIIINYSFIRKFGGWSGGAMVLGKLPVPGRLTSLDE